MPKSLITTVLSIISLALILWHPGYAVTRDQEQLEILKEGYPHAFFFRKAENISANNPDFRKWDTKMSRLMGIMGKSLDEEVLGRQRHNPEYFSRFK